MKVLDSLLEQWMLPESIDDLAWWLNVCKSADMLADVRLVCPYPEVLRLACKKLAPPKIAQIKEWVLELNRVTLLTSPR